MSNSVYMAVEMPTRQERDRKYSSDGFTIPHAPTVTSLSNVFGAGRDREICLLSAVRRDGNIMTKVGNTCQLVIERIDKLSQGNPRRLEVICTLENLERKKAFFHERELQNLFRYYGWGIDENREWFLIPEDVLLGFTRKIITLAYTGKKVEILPIMEKCARGG